MYNSSKIAQKSASKCLKPVSNPYMMSKHDLKHFWKNRKKSIFQKFFLVGLSLFDSKNREKPPETGKTIKNPIYTIEAPKYQKWHN